MHSASPGKKRHEVWQWFVDEGSRTGNRTAKHGKTKVYCAQCLDAHMDLLQETDEQSGIERTSEERYTELFMGQSAIRSDIATMLNHLRKCSHQLPTVTNWANGEYQTKYSRQSTRSLASTPLLVLPPTLPQASSSHLPIQNTPVLPLQQFSPGSFHSQLGFTPQLSPVEINNQSPALVVDAPLPVPQQPYISALGFSPQVSPNFLSHPLPSRPSSSLSSYSHGGPSISRFLPNFDQQNFNTHIGRMTVAAGLPISWTDNPEVRSVFRTFFPWAQLPSRKTLSRSILPALQSSLRAQSQKDSRGSNCTLQCDGWTAINMHHLIAFVITVWPKVYSVRVHDAHGQEKTAENLLGLLLSVIDEVRIEWGSNVVAVCSDASGESRKARRLLREKHPHLVTLDCYAHQINLVVGDFFKCNSSALEFVDLADDLITWLRSKTLVLALISEACSTLGGNVPSSIIRAIITRWTAHYLAYDRLIAVHPALMIIVANDTARIRSKLGSKIITGNAAAKAKAERMVSVIKNEKFWESLIVIKSHLEPLAIAANVTQSVFCRLDEVLMTFGSLCMTYTEMLSHGTGDEESCQAIIASIEKRWKNSDQGPFIAAVLLNPLLKISPFRPHASLSLASIHQLIRFLFVRFFPDEDTPWLFDSISEYLEGKGEFSPMEDIICEARKVSQTNTADNPLTIWKAMTSPGVTPPPLTRLAIHIFSIHANSASCERLFSLFGNIHTKQRNRMTSKTLQMIAEVKMHLRDSHAASWNQKQQSRTKRHFGPLTANNPESSRPATPSSTSSMPPPLTSGKDVDIDNDLHPIGMREMIEDFSSLAADSTDLDINPGDPSTYIWAARSICDLFDFTSNHWAKGHHAKCLHGLNEERNFYEILSNHDVDAAGVEESRFCDYR